MKKAIKLVINENPQSNNQSEKLNQQELFELRAVERKQRVATLRKQAEERVQFKQKEKERLLQWVLFFCIIILF